MIKGKLAALKLEPLTHEDLVNVMSNPFVDCCERLLEYVVAELAMSKGQVERLVKDVAFRSLEEAPKARIAIRLNLNLAHSRYVRHSRARHSRT